MHLAFDFVQEELLFPRRLFGFPLTWIMLCNVQIAQNFIVRDYVVQNINILSIHSGYICSKSFVFLYAHELAFLEPNVHKINACSNLCEEYCEHFQLVFLIPLLLLNTPSSVTLHNNVYMLDVFVSCRRWQSSTARIVIDTRTAITEMFTPLVDLSSLHCRLAISIIKYSKGLWRIVLQQNTNFYIRMLFCSL
jgi:hypothetical protein